MKRLYYILVLFFIFTGYLFPQVEENEKIEMYTLTKVNTIVAAKADTITIAKIDTTIFAEIVNEEEKKDFIKYDFYNDYLAGLKKNSFIHSDITDALSVDDCKKTGIISARVGTIIVVGAVSVTWDVPISCKINFATKGFYGEHVVVESGNDVFSGFGIGLGYVAKRTNNVIIRFNIYSSLVYSHDEKVVFGINVGTDVILWKVFSIGIDALFFKGGFIPLPTIGLNIIY